MLLYDNIMAGGKRPGCNLRPGLLRIRRNFMKRNDEYGAAARRVILFIVRHYSVIYRLRSL